MSLGRREFMLKTVGTAAAASLLGCGDDGDDGSVAVTPVGTLPVQTSVFAHGVASGDPLTNSVILWTRVSQQSAALDVRWVIATDPTFATITKEGVARATPEADFTVKVDVTGLGAGTTYYYAFALGMGRSVIGRTRTLPSTLDRARLAFTSCANYENGYFNAYRAIAKRADLDVWIHLGDYIYEYAPGVYGDPLLAAARSHQPPKEAVSLSDYRTRYAQYRTDPDLQEVHRQHPLIVVWDDHEFANNANVEGAENHDPDQGEGDWTARKRAGSQAFLEWLPIRAQPADPVAEIFRSFAFGDLFDLIMLDTRMIARAPQAGTDDGALPGENVGSPAVWADPQRQLLGTKQEDWFLKTLSSSRERGARWRLIGNQVFFAQTRSPLPPNNILFSDFWDGYQPARERVMERITSQGIQNVTFLTGDIHSSWASEISRAPFATPPAAPFAIELVGPSVTSKAFEGDPTLENATALLLPANPHVKYGEVTKKGYVLVDVTLDRLQAEWWYVRNFKAPNDASEDMAKAFVCAQSSAQLVATTTASTPKTAPALAPA